MARPQRIGKQSIDLIRTEGSDRTWTKWWMRMKTIPGVQVGDRLIAVCGLFKNTPETTILAPKGWSLILNMDAVRVYTKTATVEDTYPELVALSGQPQLVSFIFYNPKPGGLRILGEFCETYCYRNASIIDGQGGQQVIPQPGAVVQGHHLPRARSRFPDQSIIFGGEMSFRFTGANFGNNQLSGMTVVSRDAPQPAGTWSWVIGDGSIPSGSTKTPDVIASGWGGSYVGLDSYYPFAICLVGNVPPNKPQNKTPISGARVDLQNHMASFTWTYSSDDSSPQTKVSFRRATIAASGAKSAYEYWTGTGWSASQSWIANTSWGINFDPGQFTNGVTYAWSVATESAATLRSPYSDDTTVTGDTSPLVTIQAPADDITTFTPTVEWTITDPEQDPQEWYEVVLLTADALSLPGFDFQNPQTTAGRKVVWASGQTRSPTNQRQLPALHNHTSYAVFVRVFNGQTSLWDYNLFTVELIVPKPPLMLRAIVE